MSLSNLFDRIFKAQQQREESRARDYRSLVTEIASGTEPQPDRLDQILTESGKSVEQLRADVELYQQRRVWREQYDALPKLNEETATIERQIADAEKAFAAARRQFDTTTGPLQARLRQVEAERNQAEAAQARLQETCPHVELVAELQHVRDEHREAHNRHIKLDLGIKGAHEAAESDRAEAEYTGRNSRAGEYLERAKRLDAEREQMESELPAAMKQIKALVQREKAILERMLMP